MNEQNSGIVNNEQPQVAPATPEVTNTNPTVDNSQVTQPTVLPEIEIEGLGKVKVTDIKEWKQGHLRQSDYTRKTQEIAKQKSEMKDAMELYNYLKNNPQIAQALNNGDTSVMQNNPAFNALNPTNKQIEELNYRLANFELDNTLNTLKTKYNDFDELEVLKEADRLGISDLEFVHNALQGKKLPNVREEIRKEIQSQLTNQIRQNGLETQTIINTNDVQTNTASHGLSDVEIQIAKKMGLSPESYARGKKRHI